MELKLFGHDDHRYIWRRKKHHPAVEHGGGGIMMWGCSAAGGTALLQTCLPPLHCLLAVSATTPELLLTQQQQKAKKLLFVSVNIEAAPSSSSWITDNKKKKKKKNAASSGDETKIPECRWQECWLPLISPERDLIDFSSFLSLRRKRRDAFHTSGQFTTVFPPFPNQLLKRTWICNVQFSLLWIFSKKRRIFQFNSISFI